MLFAGAVLPVLASDENDTLIYNEGHFEDDPVVDNGYADDYVYLDDYNDEPSEGYLPVAREYIPTANGSNAEVEIADVTLPAGFPFRIVLASTGEWGFIESDVFHITNNEESPINVSMSGIQIVIPDSDYFSISDTYNLPDSGNNIYMALLCVKSGERYALSELGQDSQMFHLEGGESLEFRFVGAINQLAERQWSETTVSVSISFNFSFSSYMEYTAGGGGGSGLLVDDEELDDDELEDEDIDNEEPENEELDDEELKNEEPENEELDDGELDDEEFRDEEPYNEELRDEGQSESYYE